MPRQRTKTSSVEMSAPIRLMDYEGRRNQTNGCCSNGMTSVQSELDYTKELMRNNIESTLARGETLEYLASKSDDLTFQSNHFLKKASSLRRKSIFHYVFLFFGTIWDFSFIIVILLAQKIWSILTGGGVSKVTSDVIEPRLIMKCTICASEFGHTATCTAFLIGKNNVKTTNTTETTTPILADSLKPIPVSTPTITTNTTTTKLLEKLESEEKLVSFDTNSSGFQNSKSKTYLAAQLLRADLQESYVVPKLNIRPSSFGAIFEKTKFANESQKLLSSALNMYDRSLPQEKLSEVLSSVVEIDLQNAQNYEIVGSMLEHFGMYSEAEKCYERVLTLRPETPNSWIELAVCLTRVGILKYRESKTNNGHVSYLCRALRLLCFVVQNSRWDVRFDQVELTALLEISRLIKIMNETNLFVQASSIVPVSFIDFELLKSIDLDIRVVLTWDSDNTNVELEIIEPNNETCNSFQNCTSSGGMVSRDFSGGYGPVEYSTRFSQSGTYILKCKLFSTLPNQNQIINVKCRIYTNWNRTNEQREKESIVVFPLTSKDLKKSIEIAQIYCQ